MSLEDACLGIDEIVYLPKASEIKFKVVVETVSRMCFVVASSSLSAVSFPTWIPRHCGITLGRQRVCWCAFGGFLLRELNKWVYNLRDLVK